MSPASARPGKRTTHKAATTTNRAQRPLWGSLRPSALASLPSRRRHRAIGLVGLAVAAAIAAVTDMRPSMAQTRDTGTETIFADDGWPLPPDPGEPLSLLPSSRVRWDCNMFPDLETFTKDVGSLTLNNFRLRAKPGRFSNTPSAEVSFTVINRSKEKAFTTFQFTVYDRTSPLPSIAFSLEPSFGIIAADTTKQLTARVNVRPGEVERAARFCLRVDG